MLYLSYSLKVALNPACRVILGISIVMNNEGALIMETALMGQENYKVLVVCMGNICRSPTAEAVLKAKVKARGLAISVDSAGTISFHQGNPPDVRSRTAGEARGYSFAGIKSRKVTLRDFEDFDLI
jgi:Low molecular weight phosphotyrosine protein phosphatase